jgi:pimeloyl-ACP methyl ester carboxylesterase
MSPVAGGRRRTAAPPKGRHTAVGEARIFHYDAGAGPAVLLVHGFNHHADAWVRNIDPLRRAGYRVIALDLPGFGRSGIPPMSYSLAGYAGFLVEFMAAAGVERAHLVGNSMGGAIALKTAVQHPDRVITVTAVDPAGMFTRVPRTWALAGHPVVRAALRPLLGRRRLLEWSHARAYHDQKLSTPLQVDRMAEAYAQPGYTEHILGLAESMLLKPDGGLLWDELPRLRRPALIVWGRQDRTLPVQHAYRAAHRVPGAELRIYDRCGHLPMYERAADFNHDLLAFLRRGD